MNILLRLYVILLTLCKCSGETSLTMFEYCRFSKILTNAWKDCRAEIFQQCINLRIQSEPCCNLNYDEMERLKPQEQCRPMNSSLNTLCQILLFDSCSSINNAASIAALPARKFCVLLSVLWMFPVLRVIL